MINNIGFDNEASNTKIVLNKFTKKSHLNIFTKNGLLNHPQTKIINHEGDKYTFVNSFKMSFFRKINLILINPKYYLKKIYKLIKFQF